MSKGVGEGSRDLLLEFWDPLHISVTVEAKNFKFGIPVQNTIMTINRSNLNRKYNFNMANVRFH